MNWFDGKMLRDNDPRMINRYLTIDSPVVGPFGVTHYVARDRNGRKFKIAAKRIFGDGKARRYGFNVIEPKDATL
jgi:hypothetical protein